MCFEALGLQEISVPCPVSQVSYLLVERDPHFHGNFPFQHPAPSEPESCHAPSSPPANCIYGTITSSFAIQSTPDSSRSLSGPQIPTIPAALPAWMLQEPLVPLHFSMPLEQPPQFCTQQHPVPQGPGILVVKPSEFGSQNLSGGQRWDRGSLQRHRSLLHQQLMKWRTHQATNLPLRPGWGFAISIFRRVTVSLDE